MNIESIRERIIGSGIIERYRIHYIILFGSVARNKAWRFSDIDIAVKGDFDFDEFLELVADFEDVLGENVSVVDVRCDDVVLLYEVFSHGKLIYCRDKTEYLEDKMRAIKLFIDFKQVLDKFYGRILNAVSRASEKN